MATNYNYQFQNLCYVIYLAVSIISILRYIFRWVHTYKFFEGLRKIIRISKTCGIGSLRNIIAFS